MSKKEKSRLEEIIKLKDKGYSLNQIAELYGITRQRVSKIIKQSICQEFI